MKKIFIYSLLSLLTLSTLILNATKLVDVTKINSTIQLDIRYATTNNFTKQQVYPCAKCYLEEDVTLAINEVQKELQPLGLGLKIFDGYRPLSVQKIFWSIFPVPGYVADPAKGSKHNKGAAVDVTLIKLETGEELEMPSEFDDLSEKAHRQYDKMESDVIRHNCKLLESIMEKHGFVGLATEWWHFNWRKAEENPDMYPILDVSFDELEAS